MSEAVEKALLDEFYVGLGFAKNYSKTTSFHSVEQILMELA